MLFVNAQVTNDRTLHSERLLNKQNVVPVVMKAFNLDKIKAEDVINDKNRSTPYRFGQELKVNLGIDNAGVWQEFDNGDRVWMLNIKSEGAKSLNFIFDSYKIPRGATLHVYNKDKTDILGAYTNIFNRPDEMLGTWPVEGSDVYLEYFEPAVVKGQGKLHIAKVIHGYRSIGDAAVRQKALGSSADCNHDVDCPIGADFDPIKDNLKRSVGFIVLNGFVCSGTLINNVENDRAPYFLTANHCESGSEATWAFRFNWISVDPSCGTTLNSEDAEVNHTTSGATLLASNLKTDVKLLRLDGGLDGSWDLMWAGWDRSGAIPSFTVGIHHPAGDIMKVCRENDPVTKTLLNFNGEPQAETWQVADWDIGVTEGGSSGSALFDPTGRIIGQLAGGTAACSGTVDNDKPDFYGRFDVSWDFGTTDATRLSNWLDPNSTSAMTLDMIAQEGITIPPTSTDPVDPIDPVDPEPPTPEEEEEVVLFFEPEKGTVTISNTIPDNIVNYSVYDISGSLVESGKFSEEKEDIDMTSRSSGMYFIFIENSKDGTSFTQKVIVNQKF